MRQKFHRPELHHRPPSQLTTHCDEVSGTGAAAIVFVLIQHLPDLISQRALQCPSLLKSGNRPLIRLKWYVLPVPGGPISRVVPASGGTSVLAFLAPDRQHHWRSCCSARDIASVGFGRSRACLPLQKRTDSLVMIGLSGILHR